MTSGPARLEVLQGLIDEIPDAVYLEVGVSRGLTFRQIRSSTKIAVDPTFRFRVPMRDRLRRAMGRRGGELYFEMPSDEFFAGHAPRAIGPKGLDVAFLDGLHEWRQTLRDVDNALEHLTPSGCIVLHDCNPQSESAAAPSLEAAQALAGYTGTWNGDIYKVIVHLRVTRPDLEVFVIDEDQGLGVIRSGERTPLQFSAAADDIASLGYAEFAARREELLDLRPLGSWPAAGH